MDNNYHVLKDFILRMPTREADFPESDLEDILTTFKNTDRFRTALLLSSPDLYEKTERAINNGIESKKDKGLLRSLRKYYLRMGYRCTPFGMWAGFCPGKFGNTNSVIFSGEKTIQTFSRPDMILLSQIAEKEIKNRLLSSQILLFPNNTIYDVHDELRYVEYTSKSMKRQYQIVSIKKTPLLLSVLKFCKNGKTEQQIVTFLKNTFAINNGIEIINDLIHHQILNTTLEPTVTGPFYGQFLHKQIASNHTLSKSLKLLQQLDKENNTKGEEILRKIHKTVQQEYPTVNRKYIIQTDTLLPGRYILNKNITVKLIKALKVLSHLTIKRKNEDLERFKRVFMDRFNGNEMPMALLLDPETGIPYPEYQKLGDVSPLTEHISIPGSSNIAHTISSDPVTTFLHKKLKTAQRNNHWKIILKDDELTTLDSDISTPLQMAALIRILSADDKGEPEKILFEGTGGLGGANLMARMAYTNNEIQQTGQEVCDFEANNARDKIIAEVVHLPEERTGNILSRPAFYKYEIPYLAKASVNKDFQIPVSDLWLSMHGNRLVLRSKTLKREIIPRLTTAHNYHRNTLPIYRFLCDMQTDGIDFPGFSWGDLKTSYDHFPSVWYHDVCFAPECWILRGNALKELKNIADEKDGDTVLIAISHWRRRFKIPEKIVYCIHDNEIPLDLTLLYAVDLLISFSEQPQIMLKEFLYDSHHPFFSTNGKPNNNEINIIFRRNS